MTTHGGDRWPEQARNAPSATASPEDHRGPHVGPEGKFTDKLPKPAVGLLRGYMAVHGDWDEVTVNNHEGTSHHWKFTRCECGLCQQAEKLVGHPERPYVG